MKIKERYTLENTSRIQIKQTGSKSVQWFCCYPFHEQQGMPETHFRENGSQSLRSTSQFTKCISSIVLAVLAQGWPFGPLPFDLVHIGCPNRSWEVLFVQDSRQKGPQVLCPGQNNFHCMWKLLPVLHLTTSLAQSCRHGKERGILCHQFENWLSAFIYYNLAWNSKLVLLISAGVQLPKVYI